MQGTTVSINVQLIGIPRDIDSSVLEDVRGAMVDALRTPEVAKAVSAILEKFTPAKQSVTFVAY